MGIDIAWFSAGGNSRGVRADRERRRVCVVVDDSIALPDGPKVAVVVPEINAADGEVASGGLLRIRWPRRRFRCWRCIPLPSGVSWTRSLLEFIRRCRGTGGD